MLTMLSCRSSSVIRPRSYCASTSATRFSYSARICSFSRGMTMSFFEIVTPAWVAYRKPSDLIASSTAASVCAPWRSERSEISWSISFFDSVRLMNACSTGFPLPRNASVSARSTAALKITRPGVVTISSPMWRYSIGCWSSICFDSTASTTSFSLPKRLGRSSFFSFDASSCEMSLPSTCTA